MIIHDVINNNAHHYFEDWIVFHCEHMPCFLILNATGFLFCFFKNVFFKIDCFENFMQCTLIIPTPTPLPNFSQIHPYLPNFMPLFLFLITYYFHFVLSVYFWV